MRTPLEFPTIVCQSSMSNAHSCRLLLLCHPVAREAVCGGGGRTPAIAHVEACAYHWNL